MEDTVKQRVAFWQEIKLIFFPLFFFFNLMTSLEGFPLLMADSQEQISVCAKGRTFLVASEFLGASGLPAGGEVPHGCGQGPTGAPGAGVGEQFPILSFHVKPPNLKTWASLSVGTSYSHQTCTHAE